MMGGRGRGAESLNPLNPGLKKILFFKENFCENTPTSILTDKKQKESKAEGKQIVKITGRQIHYGVYMLTYRKLKQTYIQTDRQTQRQID